VSATIRGFAICPLATILFRTKATTSLQPQSKSDYFEPFQYKRVQVGLPGHYVAPSLGEFPCTALEMSSGDVLLSADVRAKSGEQIILHLDELGHFFGVVGGHDPAGFIMTLQLSRAQRDKLADQLTWFANRHLIDLPEERRHERIAPATTRAVLRLPDGNDHIVKILDLSRSGVRIETNVLPAVGTPVVVGKTPAVVVRHFDGGIAGQFVRCFAIGEIDESIRL
jgi:hypothetical protein